MPLQVNTRVSNSVLEDGIFVLFDFPHMVIPYYRDSLAIQNSKNTVLANMDRFFIAFTANSLYSTLKSCIGERACYDEITISKVSNNTTINSLLLSYKQRLLGYETKSLAVSFNIDTIY